MPIRWRNIAIPVAVVVMLGLAVPISVFGYIMWWSIWGVGPENIDLLMASPAGQGTVKAQLERVLSTTGETMLCEGGEFTVHCTLSKADQSQRVLTWSMSHGGPFPLDRDAFELYARNHFDERELRQVNEMYCASWHPPELPCLFLRVEEPQPHRKPPPCYEAPESLRRPDPG